MGSNAIQYYITLLEDKMSITIFIGNGFDKALGKKTCYQDFYNWLKKQPNSGNQFIEEMKTNIFRDLENWADFEVGLGNFIENFKNSNGAQNAVDDAMNWKKEVDRLLTAYLKNEESSNTIKNIIDSQRDIQELWDYLFAAMVFINIGYNISAMNRKREIYFISLNYTNFLDQIVAKLSKYQTKNHVMKINGEVLHPHGALSERIVLGVNNSFDFKNNELIIHDNWELESLILKQSNIENNIGLSCERKCEMVINKSMVICIYGASLGQTDEYWWKLIADWLQRDKKRRLVIFWYFSGNNNAKTNKIDKIQNVFIEKLQLPEDAKTELKKQILIYFHKRDFLFSSKQKQIFLLGNRIELPMVFVEAGSFTMGENKEGNNANEKSHAVVLTKDFYIGETPVTQEQYMAVMEKNPSKFKGDKLPVEQVTWHEAMDFCAKLNEKKLAPVGYYFTLPTEAQWEYAARGGKKGNGYRYSGSNEFNEVAWHEGNSGKTTHDVRTKSPNELDIFDMSGNVWEWCLDDYEDDNSKAAPEFVRKNNKTTSNRVDRGGAWDCIPVHVASRGNFNPNTPRYSIGFRVVLVPKSSEEA